MRILIALTGYKQCGKDTIANIIEKEFKNIQRIAFAKPLKQYISKITGYSEDEIEKLKVSSDKIIVGKKKYTMRELLINFANELRNISDDGIWAKLALSNLNTNKPILVTDLRFKVEEKILKEFAKDNNYQLFILKIVSNLDTCKSNPNEKEIELINYNFKIFNEKDNLNKTEENVKKFLQEWVNF